MHDKIDPVTGLQASILIANVGINKAEAAPLIGATRRSTSRRFAG